MDDVLGHFVCGCIKLESNSYKSGAMEWVAFEIYEEENAFLGRQLHTETLHILLSV